MMTSSTRQPTIASIVWLGGDDRLEMLGMRQTRLSQSIEADAAIREPELDRLLECGLPAGTDVHPAVDGQRLGIATELVAELVQLGHSCANVGGIEAGDQQRHPTVGLANDTAQHGIRSATADHERDGVRWQWIDTDTVQLVEAALEVDDRLGPQHSQDIHLLLEQRRAIGEVDAEGLVLGGVPTDTYGEANTSAAEQIDRCDLLGDYRGLALWQHQHAGDKAHSSGERGEVAEQHEDLVKGVLGGVRGVGEAAEWARAEPLGRGAEHVVVGEEMFEAGGLGIHRPLRDRIRIGAAVGLREDGANSHRFSIRSLRICRMYPIVHYRQRHHFALPGAGRWLACCRDSTATRRNPTPRSRVGGAVPGADPDGADRRGRRVRLDLARRSSALRPRDRSSRTVGSVDLARRSRRFDRTCALGAAGGLCRIPRAGDVGQAGGDGRWDLWRPFDPRARLRLERTEYRAFGFPYNRRVSRFAEATTRRSNGKPKRGTPSVPAGAESEDQTAARDAIDRRGLLGQHRRLVKPG